MRQIDNMTPQELEMLRVKNMVATLSFVDKALGLNQSMAMTREQKLEATLIGIRLSLEEQGGFEHTIARINAVLAS